LIILAYFVVFFEFFPQAWWTLGVAGQEIETISTILSPEWQFLLSVPQAAVQIDDKRKLVELLLAQLPAMDPTITLIAEPSFPWPTDYDFQGQLQA
jgi:hypothetical protein